MADPVPEADDAGMPRWVKVFGIVIIVLVLLVGAMLLAGHGPGQHTAASDRTPIEAAS